jgi:hypothetical protein
MDYLRIGSGWCCYPVIYIHSVLLYCHRCWTAVSWPEAHAASATAAAASSPGRLSRGSPFTRRSKRFIVRGLRWTFSVCSWLVVVVRLEVDGLSVDVVHHEDVILVLWCYRSFGRTVIIDAESPDVYHFRGGYCSPRWVGGDSYQCLVYWFDTYSPRSGPWESEFARLTWA